MAAMAMGRLGAIFAAFLALAACAELPTMVAGPDPSRMPPGAGNQRPVVVAPFVPQAPTDQTPEARRNTDAARFATAQDVQDRIDAITRALNGLPADGDSGARNVVQAIDAVTADFHRFIEVLCSQLEAQNPRSNTQSDSSRRCIDNLIARFSKQRFSPEKQSTFDPTQVIDAIVRLAIALREPPDRAKIPRSKVSCADIEK